jgi:hypothetical protein
MSFSSALMGLMFLFIWEVLVYSNVKQQPSVIVASLVLEVCIKSECEGELVNVIEITHFLHDLHLL